MRASRIDTPWSTHEWGERRCRHHRDTDSILAAYTFVGALAGDTLREAH